MTEETKTNVAEATPAASAEATTPPPPAEPTSTEESAPATISAESEASAAELPASEQSLESATPVSSAQHTSMEESTPAVLNAEPEMSSAGLPASELSTESATPMASAEPTSTQESAPATTSAETEEITAAAAASELITEATGVAPTEMVVAEEKAEADGWADEQSGDDSDDAKQVVRMLAVGQQVKGLVKRISEFGAFVDIGVGRDGLVHISELSPRRIAKVTDVLTEGQETTFWIKKLDRDRNRISLTMIEPGMKTIRNMEKGDLVQGQVTRLMPYGAFVDIGIGRDALLHVREMGERYVAKPEDVVTVGEQLEARIIDISRRRARVDLSIKGLRPEPEPEPQPEPEMTTSARNAAFARTSASVRNAGSARNPAPPPEPEPEVSDNFADVEVLSPFAAALRRAEETSGVRLSPRKEGKKDKKSGRSRYAQDEILERTLTGSRK